MSYSVIIPAYNRPEMLKRALASVYEQTILPDAIYLVIDEPNNDEKYLFLKDYDQRLVVTFTGGGYGGAKARNVGLDQAKEEYVFFLDDDDEWLPNKIEKQIQLLEQRSDCISVTCSCWEEYGHKQLLVSRSEIDTNKYIKVLNLVGGFSCFGMRLNAELRSMRLNNDLKSAQDYEFYIRVARFGKCAVVEEPLVKFYQHDEGRITSSASSHRRKTLYKVLVNNADLFSHREALFFKAKVELLTACDCSNLLIGMLQYLRGVCFLLLACMYMSLSVKILYRGASGLILSSCRLSNN